jgi:hypothetical protein
MSEVSSEISEEEMYGYLDGSGDYIPTLDESTGSIKNKNKIKNEMKKENILKDDSYDMDEFDEFEGDISQPSPKLINRQIPTTNQTKSIKSNNNIMSDKTNVLSLQTQSIQAEIALDEIGKEVLKLRNQQRVMLRERREIAKEKKQRAEERRLKYTEELKRYSIRVNDAEAEISLLKDKITYLTKQNDFIEASKSELTATIDKLNEIIISSTNKMKDMDNTIQEYKLENSNLKQEYNIKENEWNQEKLSLKDIIHTHELSINVLNKSMEANEARLAKERENLPEFHKKLVDEQLSRIQQFEAQLLEKEGAIKAEETRKILQNEQLRKNLMDEILQMRKRFEEEIIIQKADYENKLLRFENEKQQWHMKYIEEQGNLESIRLQLNQKEKTLSENEKLFDKSRIELEMKQKNIMPTIEATEHDRNEARALKVKADEIYAAAEDHASSILVAERGLLKKEQSLIEMQHQLDQLKNKLHEEQRQLSIEISKFNNSKQYLENERFKLHQYSMEISSQAETIRKVTNILPNEDNFMTISHPKLEILKANEELKRSSIPSSVFEFNSTDVSSMYPLQKITAPLPKRDDNKFQSITSDLFPDLFPAESSLTVYDGNNNVMENMDNIIQPDVSLVTSLEAFHYTTQNMKSLARKYGIM